jgi:prepilin signal peptidase PulO-like enzyme (type II secretory pathway)
MGGGDIKLIFLIGLYLGWEKTLLTLLLACIIGIIGGSIQLRKQEDVYFAFGPYIAIAAVLSLLLGDGLIGWYVSLF